MSSIEKVAIVGDIHGDAHRLRRALASEALVGRKVVFLGDYIDRGSSSREVLDILIDCQSAQPGWVFLEGNHESMLRGVRDGKVSAGNYVAGGGRSTILSYVRSGRQSVEALLAQIPASHWDFLDRLDPIWLGEGIVATHAGIPNGETVLSRTNTIYGGNEWLLDPDAQPQVRVVFGHYVQTSGRPYLTHQVACIDTGCGAGGALSVLLLPEWQCLQF